VTALLRVVLVLVGLGTAAMGAYGIVSLTGALDRVFAAAYVLSGIAMTVVAFATRGKELGRVLGKDRLVVYFGGLLAVPSVLLILTAWAFDYTLPSTWLWWSVLASALGMAILFVDLP
jgi:hypothetical protein